MLLVRKQVLFTAFYSFPLRFASFHSFSLRCAYYVVLITIIFLSYFLLLCIFWFDFFYSLPFLTNIVLVFDFEFHFYLSFFHSVLHDFFKIIFIPFFNDRKKQSKMNMLGLGVWYMSRHPWKVRVEVSLSKGRWSQLGWSCLLILCKKSLKYLCLVRISVSGHVRRFPTWT